MFRIRGFFASLMVFLCLSLFGQDARPDGVAQKESHSAIVEADGYVFLSEDKTLSEMRQEATAAAKRAALEMGETYIQSVTRVENFQLQYDLIETGSEGVVTVLESKDLGITNDNRYHVWVKTEIKYQPKKPGVTLDKGAGGPLAVQVWTDRDVYREGDHIRIFIKANQDCYVRVVHVSAEGQILQLLPNPLRSDHFCRKETVVQIPGPEDAFQLEVIPPFGREEIVVFASTGPLGEIPLSQAGRGLYLVSGNFKDLAQKTRGVRIVPVEDRPVQAAEFVEIRRSIVVEKE